MKLFQLLLSLCLALLLVCAPFARCQSVPPVPTDPPTPPNGAPGPATVPGGPPGPPQAPTTVAAPEVSTDVPNYAS
ncbi:lysine-rich arabinogalactan protein 19 [Drosophila busckii]|uniref:lysine-rich arabinogalactan protein 19 n=1 Tax=Drosophila busckii TaxID=30019 RepID=UPI00083EB85B|nr:lysine-rich arabinogalactan protein 19 [Drosophila busckii]